jgi:hypothetical protein
VGCLIQKDHFIQRFSVPILSRQPANANSQQRKAFPFIRVPLLSRQQIMTHHEHHENQRSIPKSFSFPKSVPIRPIRFICVPFHPTLQRPITASNILSSANHDPS